MRTGSTGFSRMFKNPKRVLGHFPKTLASMRRWRRAADSYWCVSCVQSATEARNKLIHLIGLGEVVPRLGRVVAECLHRPVQVAQGFPDRNQIVSFTPHTLFSHARQTPNDFMKSQLLTL